MSAAENHTAPPPAAPTSPPATDQNALNPAAPNPPATSPDTTGQPEAADSESIADAEELKRLLVGKPLYLRGGYLDNTLSFDEHGKLIGHSPQGSYTLSAIQIDRVRLTKHRVELEGARYGLHFLGQLAYEDPGNALDRVRITPKKKVVKIAIDREQVVMPKKKKEKEKKKETEKRREVASKDAAPATPGAPTQRPADPPQQPATSPQAAAEPPAATPNEAESSAATQATAPPAADKPPAAAESQPAAVIVTPKQAAKRLREAIDQIFATGLDDRLMASLPDFWKLYYQAVAAKTDYRPSDPAVLRQNTVDQKAALLSRFEPESNEYAQANGVAGMALYHTVVGADGKPGEIAVGRPIGFGLDENAVEAIRKATFQPAVKDGKPVPVLLDLVVQFRIFSKRTAVASKPEPADKPAEPVLPGPYSVPHS
jgi:hypothetical protein